VVGGFWDEGQMSLMVREWPEIKGRKDESGGGGVQLGVDGK